MNLRITLALAAALAGSIGAQSARQSAEEQLQQGIFAQDAQGNLDAAISTFRQLANSSLTPRDIAATAQYRLTQSLIAKGDLSSATREMERLERDFPEQRQLISNLAANRNLHPATAGAGQPSGLAAVMMQLRTANFDGGTGIMIRGRVSQVNWVNPLSYLVLDGGSQKFVVSLASPNQLYQSGMTRTTFQANDEVVVSAQVPASGRLVQDGAEGVRAIRITHLERGDLFDRSKLPPAAQAGTPTVYQVAPLRLFDGFAVPPKN